MSARAFDLRGNYQDKNLRTVLAALELLGVEPDWDALAHTAARTGLRGRWETLREAPLTLCDIGHNPAALRENFAQLEAMMASGRFDRLHIVYGVMADKALDDIVPLMPRDADYYFATPATPRALPAADIAARFQERAGWLSRCSESGETPCSGMLSSQHRQPSPQSSACTEDRAAGTVPEAFPERDPSRFRHRPGDGPVVTVCGSVADAIREAEKNATENSLIYIGGSTFVVSEAITYYESL